MAMEEQGLYVGRLTCHRDGGARPYRFSLVLTISGKAPVPLPSAPTQAIPGAPFLRGPAFLLFPSTPATFSILLGAFRLTCEILSRPHFGLQMLPRRVASDQLSEFRRQRD